MSGVYVTTEVRSQEFQEFPEFYQKGSSTNEGKLSEKEVSPSLDRALEVYCQPFKTARTICPEVGNVISHHTPTADEGLVVVEGMGNDYDEGARQLEDDEGDEEG
ncbi:hypothetical protein EDC04DRAFT_2608528 [Pisolithus marmoratus]|nr:hypothetical protein EDC04DRAFT_2608528 [Pisolithus marmoratus]